MSRLDDFARRQPSGSGIESTKKQPRVFIVDNDIHALDSLERLLRFEGFAVDRFTSADEFLEHAIGDVPSCVIAA
jgi:FixJ family two-component response regulator